MASGDFIDEIGVAVLPHHMRRLVDQIMASSADNLAKLNLKTPPRAVSTMLLLDREGELAITRIAERLRLSHPQVIRNVRDMIAAGLASDRLSKTDRRVRIVKLTRRGQSEARLLADHLRRVEQLYRQLFDEIGADLFEATLRASAALQTKSYAERYEELLEEEIGA